MTASEVKLIALDLDGTTLDSKGKVSAETKEALAKATKEGVHVVVATGRPLSAITEEVLALEGIEYMITSNGAAITRLSDMEVVFKANLSPEAVEAAKNILKDTEYLVEVFVHGKAYIDKKMYETVENYGLLEHQVQYIKRTRKPTENIMDFLMEHKYDVENINIDFADQEEKMRMRQRMEALGVATVTSSLSYNVELGGLETSKANAIAHLCKILGITAEEVMACGDSPNDIAMLEFAGISVAMGNGRDEVKAIAKYITGSNDEHGVAQAVYRFVVSQ